jgi:hypothetical protein
MGLGAGVDRGIDVGVGAAVGVGVAAVAVGVAVAKGMGVVAGVAVGSVTVRLAVASKVPGLDVGARPPRDRISTPNRWLPALISGTTKVVLIVPEGDTFTLGIPDVEPSSSI